MDAKAELCPIQGKNLRPLQVDKSCNIYILVEEIFKGISPLVYIFLTVRGKTMFILIPILINEPKTMIVMTPYIPILCILCKICGWGGIGVLTNNFSRWFQ